MTSKARSRKHDWFELAATILLSVATIVAAWSAYQSTRWNGVQALNTTAAAARRIDATQQNAIYSGQVQLDVLIFLTYLEHRQIGDESGAAFLRERFRPEFVPAFEAWAALVPAGEVPPGTPFELPEYQPAAQQAAAELNAEAETLSAAAREANQVGDDFVLVAVIMASVLFCAGVGTKVSATNLRLVILCTGLLLFISGTTFMLSLPQNLV